MNNTVSDNASLIELGLNPGLVENYYDVSAEPVSFSCLDSLGWGKNWQSNHSGKSTLMDGEIEIDGREFTANNSVSGYSQLIEEWRKL